MTTENNEWKPRNHYNDGGQNEDGLNEKNPYQSYNRTHYGNSSGNYRQGGNYNRPKQGYDRGNSSNYNQRGPNYNNPRGNNYNRRENDYNYRPQRSYDNHPNSYDNPQRIYDGNRQPNSSEDASAGKKRRPRVGDAPVPARNPNYYQGHQGQGGNYNQDFRGGYQKQQQRPYQQQRNQAKSFNRNSPVNRNNPQKQGATFVVKRQTKYHEEYVDLNEPIRLNKFLSNSGVCSRREADDFIRAGLVKVNGETVSELGIKVKRSDEITFHNEPVKLEQKIYVLLNKPKNCVTTADDPQERLTVMDLVKTACQERIVPVGRLDRNTTGVLLLTNDGDLASKLTHPKFLKKKIYHVWLDKEVSVADMQKLAEGVELEDGEIHADAVSYVSETDASQVGIEIHSGRNRVVRRMLEALGYHVVKLDRVYFAGLTKKNLKRGQWRYLNEREVSMLRMGAFE